MPEPAALPGYAELHAISAFSFGRGASLPQELVQRAAELGYAGLALTDECSVAGVVRAWTRLRELREEGRVPEGFALLYGSEFALPGGRLIAIARHLEGWGGLCRFITAARTAGAAKGSYQLDWQRSDFSLLAGCEILWAPEQPTDRAIDTEAVSACMASVAARFDPEHLWLAVELLRSPHDPLWLATLRLLGARHGLALVAAGGVCMHRRSRKPLQDVLTATRLNRPVADCGLQLQPSAERHLRHRLLLSRIYPRALLQATLQVLQRCRGFDLAQIRYDYPQESLPAGLTPSQALRRRVLQGMAERYPQGTPVQIKRYLVKELRLIAACRYEMFFLTVDDIVRFARSRAILCQGRGSAANSVVCWCLGITAANPEHSHPLLERFISRERRHEPPDIDVDFEHERREEVIQYLYAKYGRERAALAAAVISWRKRSAIRAVGAALALPQALIDAYAQDHPGFHEAPGSAHLQALAMRTLGQPLSERSALLWPLLARQLLGLPRHLSQHVGGFVLTQTPLTRLVPVESAAMAERSVIQWDKNDIEALGLMKVDVLALGMLSAIRRTLELASERRGAPFTRYDITPEDPATYAMARRANTVGVFQIESRAQMAMLPRLKPATFYDLVVQVALVRPGPVAGGMVRPYLLARSRRAAGRPLSCERSALEDPAQPPRLAGALARTLGVPVFQEQVMQIAILAAGFSPGEADALRRGMATFKHGGNVQQFEARFIGGMVAGGYKPDFARRLFDQIKGFGEYGFPESHAWSFALLAYESAWLKCHEPEAFVAALLNSQPMGFYTPSQLIQDARRNGVVVLPVDVTQSDWDCRLQWPQGMEASFKQNTPQTLDGQAQAAIATEANTAARPAVRLGLRLVGSLSREAGVRIVQARTLQPLTSTEDLAQRAQLDRGDLNALAAADALAGLAGHRRQQAWDAAALHVAPRLLQGAPMDEPPLSLPPAPEAEEIIHDYAALGLTLRRHPLALLRPHLTRRRLASAAALLALPSGRSVRACGLVTVRQRPQTAGGTVFVTLEDETGIVNVIIGAELRERQRQTLLHARLLAVQGRWQRTPGAEPAAGSAACHLVARQLADLTPLLGRLAEHSGRSRDFR
ncbi:error-prone DNA polymerase [Comamonas sp. NLF-1-9]|uniref:error-prone DNA polymerase n=1 Tax=Comamonas sp. NLF-1-9 TaxID=2853163 RepID=UPI002104EA6B|nr:error-prone DNA polymerase [Comamonas sp. NLF-1-9]